MLIDGLIDCVVYGKDIEDVSDLESPEESVIEEDTDHVTEDGWPESENYVKEEDSVSGLIDMLKEDKDIEDVYIEITNANILEKDIWPIPVVFIDTENSVLSDTEVEPYVDGTEEEDAADKDTDKDIEDVFIDITTIVKDIEWEELDGLHIEDVIDIKSLIDIIPDASMLDVFNTTIPI